jgi:GTP cyclohydrolase IA
MDKKTFVHTNILATELALSRLEAWKRTPEDHRAKTPERFLKMLWDMTSQESAQFEFTTFPAQARDMIVLSPIPFYTFCAHHIVPFYGHVHIGYVPDQKLAGLSKFARAVKYVAKGLWVQEEFTSGLADFLVHQLEPLGVAVVAQAEHLCMAMRGVEEAGVITTTSNMQGVFADHERTAKAEFMQLIERNLR